MATLHGYKPKRFVPRENTMALAQWGAGETAAHLARQRMCRGPNQGEGRAYCSCKEAGQALCGCGCREMLPPWWSLTPMDDLDMCEERGTYVWDEELEEEVPTIVIMCGPSGASWR